MGLMIAVLAVTVSSCDSGSPSPSPDALIKRGYYLVHNVAMCIDCHSPRGKDGKLIESRQLTGATLDFKAIVPMPWMSFAPNLTGLPAGYTTDEMIHYLMTGIRPRGLAPAQPPMPAYRMNQADAEAITAYLASLPRLEE